MNHIDPREGINEDGRGNYTCDNLEDALKQMEGLVEETLKSSSKRRKPLNSTENRNSHCLDKLLTDCHSEDPFSGRMNGDDGINSILDQFVSEQQDFLLPFHYASSNDDKYLKRDIKTSYKDDNVKEDMITSSSKANKQCDTERNDVQSENSNLKLRLAKIENELKDKDEKVLTLEVRVTELQSLLNDRMIEVGQLKSRLARSNPSSPDRSLASSFRDRTLEREQTLERLKKKHLDVEKLKSAVETLMVSNEEKNVRIEEMKVMLKKYKKLEELVAQKQGQQMLETCGLDLKDGIVADALENKSPLQQELPLVFIHPSSTSTPVNPHSSSNGFGITHSSSTLPSPVKNSIKAESFGSIGPKIPLIAKGQSVSSSGFGDDVIKDEMAQQYKAMLNQPHVDTGKRKLSTGKTIKKLFNKLKRSNSQEFDDKIEDFKRAGLRSTAGPRLGGWNRGIENELNIPFGHWDADRVATWMHFMGLGCYVGECKRWVKSGDHLLTATSHELEKELGMKNPFHRKKLQLALQVVTSDPHSPMSFLDHAWVTKWLDDIGLPQYKDQFSEAKIDGRMINYLTNEDLMNLKVTSLLHHLSLKCGIQVLRNNHFNPSCLRRRPATDELGVLHNCPEEVMLWTNHRVMEWLRSIDLSEYAPNLRGSGVHGGLMVLESRFSAEVLAAILSIPLNKTLLRRHLTTHFVALIGNNVQQQKRNIESDPNYVPLTTNQKVKPPKKIGLFRPRTADLKDDFVCPLDSRSSSHKLDGISKPSDIPTTESSFGDQGKIQEVSSSNV